MLARKKEHQKSNGGVFFFSSFICFISLSVLLLCAVSPCLSSKLNDYIDTQICNWTSNANTYTCTHTKTTQTHGNALILYTNELITCVEECTQTHRTDTDTRTQSDTHLQGNFTQLLVSWVNLFGRSWIWQSSSSTANNTETNEFISSTPLFTPSPSCCTFALLFSLFLSLVLPSVSICLSHAHSSSSFLSESYCFSSFPLLRCPSWTSSLYLHRWFQWLLWVLIIPSITVGKCAIKVDSYSVPCGSIFIRITPDFKDSGVFRCFMPSSQLPRVVCERHHRGISTFYFPNLFLCRDSH